MKAKARLVFAVLVFLTSLFLSKTAFLAVVATGIFFLLVMVIEAAYRYLQMSKYPKLLRLITNLSVVAVLVLSCYILFFLPFY